MFYNHGIVYIKLFFAEGEMDTEAEENNCFSIIFGGGYQGLQNNRLKHRNADEIVGFHTRI